MKFLFVTGSRSEWGYIKPILDILKKKKYKTDICLTNMHLLESYGYTLNEIKKDGHKVNEKIYMALDGYNTFTMTKSLGHTVNELSTIFDRIKPDVVFVIADRYENLAVAIVSSYMNIFLAHKEPGSNIFRLYYTLTFLPL